MRKVRFQSVRNIAGGAYIRWIADPRLVTVGIMLVFIHSFAVQPLLHHAQKYGEPLQVFEPFLAVCNSGLTVLLIPVVFILLMSDFPVMTGNTFLTVVRAGKTNWFLGQMLFSVMCILSYVSALFLGCAVMSRGVFGENWSDTVTHYGARFPEEAHSFVSQLLPPNLYNQIPLPRALLYSAALLALFLWMIALILCLMKMLYLQTAGILSVTALTAVGAALSAVKSPVQWYFPTANLLIWLHYQEILREPVTPVAVSFLYFALADGMLFAANLFVVRRLQFQNTEG